MITQKQKKLLAYLSDVIEETGGIGPSYDEMRVAMGLASKSGIHRMIKALEERGYIQRLPNKARAIKIIPRDDAVAIYGKASKAHDILNKICHDRSAQGLPLELKTEILSYFQSVSPYEGIEIARNSKLLLEAAE